MKPIQKGMTTAVTRGELEAAKREGRAPVADVTQLTWFEDVKMYQSIAGLHMRMIAKWYSGGFYNRGLESDKDLFAPPEYEWQWIVQHNDGNFAMTNDHFKTEKDVHRNFAVKVIEPYEPSKREVE